MSGHGEKFTRKQEVALAALAAYPTLGEAAQACGVSVATLRRWLQRPDFRAGLRKAGRNLLDASLDDLIRASRRAVQVLVEAMESEKETIRVKAAMALLDRAVSATQAFDFEARLEAIEEALARPRAGRRA
jgi:predicted site-specific integrase-resolvase